MCTYNNNDISNLCTYGPCYCPYAEMQYQCPYRTYFSQFEGFTRQKQGPPKTPPPSFTPQLSNEPETSLMAVDSGAIAPCVYKFSYIWLRNGQSFWAYLVYVGRTSASGWRHRRGRWEYFGVDLKQIKSFTCY